jgi:hypothetical protein
MSAKLSAKSAPDRVVSARPVLPAPALEPAAHAQPGDQSRDESRDPWAWTDKAVERWKGLSERRRNHLLELYRSGRWRHYYASEEALARELREVARGIADWRGLLPSETAAAATLAPEGSPAANEAATIAPEPEADAAAASDGAIALPGFIPGDRPS